jgi:hypothetical protein
MINTSHAQPGAGWPCHLGSMVTRPGDPWPGRRSRGRRAVARSPGCHGHGRPRSCCACRSRKHNPASRDARRPYSRREPDLAADAGEPFLARSWATARRSTTFLQAVAEFRPRGLLRPYHAVRAPGRALVRSGMMWPLSSSECSRMPAARRYAGGFWEAWSFALASLARTWSA